MVIEKEWLTLAELANKWKCTVDELIHIGVTGRLIFSFDWVLINNEIKLSSLPLKLDLALPNEAGYSIKQIRFFAWLRDERSNDLQTRLFPLSASEISVIHKNGFISVKKHYDPISNLLLQLKPETGAENIKYPKLTIDQIIISTPAITTYENNIAQEKHESSQLKNNDGMQTKEKTNLYKTIGLLTKALLDKGSANLKVNNKVNIKAIASKLEQYIPSDPKGQKELHGLSERSLRDRLTKGLESLNSD